NRREPHEPYESPCSSHVRNRQRCDRARAHGESPRALRFGPAAPAAWPELERVDPGFLFFVPACAVLPLEGQPHRVRIGLRVRTQIRTYTSLGPSITGEINCQGSLWC